MNLPLILFILILPILCFITRRLSPPLYSNNLREFNEKSFYAPFNKIIIKNNSKNNELNIQDYNNTRIFFETQNNKIILDLTFSKENYYEEKRIHSSIILNINKSSNITFINNSFHYEENFENKSLNIQFKKIKESFHPKKIKYFLKFISIKFDNNYNNLECELFFDDLYIKLNLNKEKFTYKFFYILESLINQIYFFIILCINLDNKNNLQNISIIFLLIIRSKIFLSIIDRIIDLYIIGFPFFKTLFFYFHLLIYGELLLSITDFVIIFILFLFLICLFNYLQILKDNDGNYFYCFNNKIQNNKIVINTNKPLNLSNFYIKFGIILCIVETFEFTNNIYFKFIPFYISLVLAIIKHLLQREVMSLKDKDFCISFYFYGVITYSYYLFIFNIGKFYRIKCAFSIFPFIIALLLYLLLNYIISNNYKIKNAMKEDFEKLKNLKKECCSICLEDFKYNKYNENKLFCKVTQEDNIHKTSCNHYFHEKCLFIWRKNQNICPICKKRLDTPNFYYFYDYIPCLYKWE